MRFWIVHGYKLLLLAVIGMMVSDRLWVRILCTLCLAAYGIVVVAGVVNGTVRPSMLGDALLYLFLVLFVHHVYKGYGKW